MIHNVRLPQINEPNLTNNSESTFRLNVVNRIIQPTIGG